MLRKFAVALLLLAVLGFSAATDALAYSKLPAYRGDDPSKGRLGTVAATVHPLVAEYSIEAPPTAKVYVEFGPTTSYGLRTSEVRGGGLVKILVAGMRPSTTYHMRAVTVLPGGNMLRDLDHAFITGPLPNGRKAPTITVTKFPEAEPQSGVEMLSMTGTTDMQAVVTDLDGNVIWYYDYDLSLGAPLPMKLMPNGHILLALNVSSTLREVDLAGVTIRELTPATLQQRLEAAGLPAYLGSGKIHHDFAFLPNGHIVVLVQFDKVYNDIAGIPGETTITADGLIDLDADWNPVWVWSTTDHFDISRAPWGYPDWTHSNAVIYSKFDRNLIFSSRSQSWLTKIDYRDGIGTGAILWKLGPGGDFTLNNGSDSDWFYSQHDVRLLDSTDPFPVISVFDNGNNRPDDEGTPCGDAVPCQSRAAIFQLNRIDHTARVVWEYKSGLYAPFLGSHRVLANGNSEMDVGAINGRPNATIREVNHLPIPDVVWEMNVTGAFVYRGVRLPSLYPGVQW